ncbi:MAG: hypothetical protein WCF35_14575, partial [Pseudolabrys sp.]
LGEPNNGWLFGNSVLGHAIRLPSSKTDRFCQRIRDQIMGSIAISGDSRLKRSFGSEIILK